VGIIIQEGYIFDLLRVQLWCEEDAMYWAMLGSVTDWEGVSSRFAIATFLDRIRTDWVEACYR
jgi:hypothetical protein